MSKTVSRRARNRLAKSGGLAAVIGANMNAPKPGRSLERSHASPNRLGALSARFNDPAGNTFKARTVGRKRQDRLEVEQGPLVFTRGPDGVVRAKRDKSQAWSLAGSSLHPFEPAPSGSAPVTVCPTAQAPSFQAGDIGYFRRSTI
jgi:hypothetical protein